VNGDWRNELEVPTPKRFAFNSTSSARLTRPSTRLSFHAWTPTVDEGASLSGCLLTPKTLECPLFADPYTPLPPLEPRTMLKL